MAWSCPTCRILPTPIVKDLRLATHTLFPPNAGNSAGPDQRELIERPKNRVRVLPSSIEIAHMETAVAWPAHYLGSFPQLLRVVQLGAVARSRHFAILGGSSASCAYRVAS